MGMMQAGSAGRALARGRRHADRARLHLDSRSGTAAEGTADLAIAAAAEAPGRPVRRVLILCGDSDRNLGDHAIVQAMCQELRAASPRLELSVLSRDPRRAERDFGAKALPPGWRGVSAVWKAAARADLVLCGGGGLFQDDDSLAKMPYWAVRVALARILAGRVVGYALGVGPLRAASSRLFARLAFACMEQVSARDRRAQDVAQVLTAKPVFLLPDPALVLRSVDRESARALLAAKAVPLDGRPLIGVAIRRWFPPRTRLIPHRLTSYLLADPHDSPQGHAMIALLAQVLDGIVARLGAHVLFLPTYNARSEGDHRVCGQVRDRMTQPGAQVLLIDEAPLYKAVCGQLSVVLGGRMHPTILAASAGTPVVGLAYNQKFDGFLELIGAADRVLDVASFVAEQRTADLEAMVEAALRDGSAQRDRIALLKNQIQQFTHGLVAAPVSSSDPAMATEGRS
jgi:polysaccharide pyruvyl transferase CsaB